MNECEIKLYSLFLNLLFNLKCLCSHRHVNACVCIQTQAFRLAVTSLTRAELAAGREQDGGGA